MGKFNCCVRNCANNWRNSPELKFHSHPRDPKVFAQYVRLMRNGNLKEFSVTDNTKICGKHFPNGERVCRTIVNRNKDMVRKAESRDWICYCSDLCPVTSR